MVDSLRSIQREEQSFVDQQLAMIDSIDQVTLELEAERVALGDSLDALKARAQEEAALVRVAADSLARNRARVEETVAKVNALRESQRARSGQKKPPS
jgi:hypothetical protein